MSTTRFSCLRLGPPAACTATPWAMVGAIPPLGTIGTKLFGYEQLKRSFYIYVFQTPMAEMAVGLDDMAFIDGLWRDWSPGYNASQDIAAVKDALRDPANLAAAIGYYRAMLGATPPDPAYSAEAAAASGVAPQPTLFLHGDRDGSTAPELYADAAALLSPGSKVETVAGTRHFFHLEKPAAVNRLIVDWITAPPWSSLAGAGCGRASPAPAARYP